MSLFFPRWISFLALVPETSQWSECHSVTEEAVTPFSLLAVTSADKQSVLLLQDTLFSEQRSTPSAVCYFSPDQMCEEVVELAIKKGTRESDVT